MAGAIDRIGKKVIKFHEIIGEMLILLGQTVYFFREAPRNLASIFARWPS